MFNTSIIKRIAKIILKGLPFVIVLAVLANWGARTFVKHAQSVYQTSAKIKLDDQAYGVSNNNLFQDFDHFSTLNKVESEVELMKSNLILEAAILNTNYQVEVSKVQNIKNLVLSNDETPFMFSIVKDSFSLYDSIMTLKFASTTKGQCTINGSSYDFEVGVPFNIQGSLAVIELKDSLVSIADLTSNRFLVEVYSLQRLIKKTKENLFVKQVDKDVAVVNLYFKDANSQRGAQVLNAICEAYIQDHVANRTSAARKTTDFIDGQLIQISNELKTSENLIETYMLENNVVNTRQESETGLRKLSDLKVQLINLQMNEKAIVALERNIQSGDYFDEQAINIGFGDLVMAELVKKLKLLSDERQDLLLRYKPAHDKVQSIDLKIAQAKNYIKNAVSAAKQDIEIKTNAINEALAIEDKEFDDFPTKEKKLKRMQREFQLSENLFMFLTEKRNESAIAAVADISFHRIIETAVVGKLPYSPNKTLIVWGATVFAFLMGWLIIFAMQSLSTKVSERDYLEKNTSIPILGTIKTLTKDKNRESDFGNLATALTLKDGFENANIITINSALRKEGKTTIAKNMALAFSRMGYSVLLLDADLQSPSLHNEFDFKLGLGLSNCIVDNAFNNDYCEKLTSNLHFLQAGRADMPPFQLLGHKNLPQILKQIKSTYEIVIVDSSASAISNDAANLMRHSNFNLTSILHKKTTVDYALNAEFFIEEYNLKNNFFILNNVPDTTNYNGNFISSKLNYNKKANIASVLIKKVKAYAS